MASQKWGYIANRLCVNTLRNAAVQVSSEMPLAPTMSAAICRPNFGESNVFRTFRDRDLAGIGSVMIAANDAAEAPTGGVVPAGGPVRRARA